MARLPRWGRARILRWICSRLLSKESRPHRRLSSIRIPRFESDVEILDVERVVLDELSSRLDCIAHQDGEHLIGLDDVVDLNVENRSRLRIQRGLPKLGWVHLAQPLVALNRDVFFRRSHQVVEQRDSRIDDRMIFAFGDDEGRFAQSLKLEVQLHRLLKLDVGRELQIYKHAAVASRARDCDLESTVLFVFFDLRRVAGLLESFGNFLQQLFLFEELMQFQALSAWQNAAGPGDRVDNRLDDLSVVEPSLELVHVAVKFGQLLEYPSQFRAF